MIKADNRRNCDYKIETIEIHSWGKTCCWVKPSWI